MEVDWDKVMCTQSVTGIWIGLRKLNSNWSFGISLENEMKNERMNTSNRPAICKSLSRNVFFLSGHLN